jgi:hypothetical protein
LARDLVKLLKPLTLQVPVNQSAWLNAARRLTDVEWVEVLPQASPCDSRETISICGQLQESNSLIEWVNQLQSLTAELCSIFRDEFVVAPTVSVYLPSACLSQSLNEASLLFKRASSILRTVDLFSMQRGLNWADVVALLFILAYHMLLVQTCYGTRMPQPTTVAKMVGMKEACAFIQQHAFQCTQLEALLEGVTTLVFCGGPVAVLILSEWLCRCKRNVLTACNWPTAVAHALSSSLNASATQLQATTTASNVLQLIHLDAVLLMAAAALQVTLSL